MRDPSTLGAAGLVVAMLALASLAAQPRPPSTATSFAKPVAAKDGASPPASEHVNVLRDGGKLDLNRATVGDLELLPSIGPALARRIVEDRAHGGAYAAVNDLVRVPGIGAGKLARIRGLVAVNGNDAAQRSNRKTAETRPVK